MLFCLNKYFIWWKEKSILSRSAFSIEARIENPIVPPEQFSHARARIGAYVKRLLSLAFHTTIPSNSSSGESRDGVESYRIRCKYRRQSIAILFWQYCEKRLSAVCFRSITHAHTHIHTCTYTRSECLNYYSRPTYDRGYVRISSRHCLYACRTRRNCHLSCPHSPDNRLERACPCPANSPHPRSIYQSIPSRVAFTL